MRINGGRAALLALAMGAAGCAVRPGPGARARVVTVEQSAPQPEWAGITRPADLDRIQRISQAWQAGLAAARTAGFTRRIRAEGALLDPEAALPWPSPAPGAYRCRLLRIGGAVRGARAFSVAGPFFCYIGGDGPLLSLTRQTGSPRPGGYLYFDNGSRMIFIGADAEGREQVPPAYATRPERDLVGVMERVDEFRYRLVLPWRRSGPLEIYELVPAVQ